MSFMRWTTSNDGMLVMKRGAKCPYNFFPIGEGKKKAKSSCSCKSHISSDNSSPRPRMGDVRMLNTLQGEVFFGEFARGEAKEEDRLFKFVGAKQWQRIAITIFHWDTISHWSFAFVECITRSIGGAIEGNIEIDNGSWKPIDVLGHQTEQGNSCIGHRIHTQLHSKLRGKATRIKASEESELHEGS